LFLFLSSFFLSEITIKKEIKLPSLSVRARYLTVEYSQVQNCCSDIKLRNVFVMKCVKSFYKQEMKHIAIFFLQRLHGFFVWDWFYLSRFVPQPSRCFVMYGCQSVHPIRRTIEGIRCNVVVLVLPDPFRGM